MWLTYLFAVLRCYVVYQLIRSGSPVAACYAVGEAIAIGLGVMNEFTHKERDKRAVGFVLPLCYLVGYLIVPIGNGSASLVVPLSIVVFVLSCVRVWMWNRTSLAKATWVSLIDRGPYAIVRHPQTGLAMLARLIFIAANFSLWNVFASLVYIGAMIIASRVEETFCDAQPEYRGYCERVRYRFCPGVV